MKILINCLLVLIFFSCCENNSIKNKSKEHKIESINKRYSGSYQSAKKRILAYNDKLVRDSSLNLLHRIDLTLKRFKSYLEELKGANLDEKQWVKEQNLLRENLKPYNIDNYCIQYLGTNSISEQSRLLDSLDMFIYSNFK